MAPNPHPPAPARSRAGHRHHCAALSVALAEPVAASAPPAGGSWLAVEHPGPWPARPERADLPAAARAVLRRAQALGIRTQLIRRPGRHPTPPPHTVFVASHRGHRAWLHRALVGTLSALTALDLAALAEGTPPDFGRPAAGRLLLVCTHGRRDACCAQFGRPAAVAMAAAYPGRVWETTHLGGDRFAGNVACLPEGTYHGRVTADTAATVAAACLAGRVHLPHYRGRAGLPAPTQAAEHALRLATGLAGVGDVCAQAGEPPTTGHTGLVRLTVAGHPVTVPVRALPAGPPRPVCCADGTLAAPTGYRVDTAAAGRETGQSNRTSG